MSLNLSRSARATIVGVLVSVSPFGAEAMTVGCCNLLIDGVYKPALVVENNGKKTIHLIGEDGLTRTIAFNSNAAMAWASEKYGTDRASVFLDESCTISADGDSSTLLPIGSEGDWGGGDCGGGDCGGGDCGGQDSLRGGGAG